MSDGLTLVVSPLISLMEDQVQQLRDEALPALMLNSTLSPAMQREVIEQVRSGFKGMLYIAPERFFAGSFQMIARTLRPTLLAIDEAHCISQWGHDFRPEYARLGEARRLLGNPTTIAVTATATHDVRADIVRQLGLENPHQVVTGFDRPTLRYECRHASKTVDRETELLALLSTEPGSCIVYASTRKTVDEVTSLLSTRLRDRPIFAYHAGMDSAARTSNQERFMQTHRAIAVATNAFGMGINKPDIRLVVHYNLPGTLEAYYQEAGRAGRDGQPSRCVMIFSYQDRHTQDFFISRIGRDIEHGDPAIIERMKAHASAKLELMVRYAQQRTCRRRSILDYFGDESAVESCNCDVCVPEGGNRASEVPVSDDVVLLVRQLLSAIARCRGAFGLYTVAQVLVGDEDEKIRKWGLDQLSVFGLCRSVPIKRAIAMLHRLCEAGLARQKDPPGVEFNPVVTLTGSGVDVMKGVAKPPSMLRDLAPKSDDSRRGRRKRRSAPEQSTERIEVEPDFDEEAERRFQRLRAARAELAREKQLPPYCICHDRTLKSIAVRAPSSLQSLETIKGLGPMKIKLYGSILLTAVLGSD